MKLEFPRHIFAEDSNIKFYEKSVHWQPNFSMWKDRWTNRRIDMKKLIVTFRNFANVPDNPPPQKIKITNSLFFLMECSWCLQL